MIVKPYTLLIKKEKNRLWDLIPFLKKKKSRIKSRRKTKFEQRVQRIELSVSENQMSTS